MIIWIALDSLGLDKDGNSIKVFAQSDNTSALGWLYRQTFYRDLSHLQEEVPRLIGEDLMGADTSLYSQHVKGVANIIADILSRSNLPANKLVQFLKENHGNILPDNF